MSADFWAGYVSGAAGIIIGNPLDLVKTRLQAGTIPPRADGTNPSASPTAAPQSFRGQFENAGTLVRGDHCPSTQELYATNRPEN
jgi:solute carrier family 25 carnitine/acylcarnitine transporter 20/29